MEKKPKIVVLDRDTVGVDVDFSRIQQYGDTTVYGRTDYSEIGSRIADADIVITNKCRMSKETLEGAKHLKLICLTATGTNNVDKKYTTSRGIGVANVAGYSTNSVVQHTFAMLFYVWEKLAYYDAYVKSGAYTKSPDFCHMDQKFSELAGKTYGIIGLGAIGREVAAVAKAFGCRVIYYSTSGKNDNNQYEQVTFSELLTQSDVVSIHAPLNERTEGLMNREAFRMMKPQAVLLNAGRGPIVVEEDLVQALEQGVIAGAALDVISVEPMLPDNPLLRMKDSGKLLVTPHIAWATVEARQRVVDEVCLNIEAFLKGEERNRVYE